MPIALQADWPLIQALYQQGTPVTTISEQTGVKQGTIASRATRARWRAVAAKAVQVVQELSPPPKAESASDSKLAGSSERTRARLARLVERSAEKIEEMSLRSPAHALRVNGELESVVRNAKTVFGWTENQTAPAIRIGVLAQVTIQPAAGPTSAPESSQSQPAIEVESIAIPDPTPDPSA